MNRYILPLSVLGTAVGGAVLLKDFVAGGACPSKATIPGKTVIVTGANTGIGKQTALELAKRGGNIILACRDLEKCEAAAKDIRGETLNHRVSARHLDLASLTSVREFAAKINEEEEHLHVLINNAAVMRCPHWTTEDGFEMQHGAMVAMFFTVSVVNNYALNLNIAMPLHMIFRSGSLIANMILGIIILKKRYSIFKYTSIALVSVGIFICTFMSAKQVTSQSSSSENDGFQAFAWWLLGIGALTFALLMSARMGIFQETLYRQFGKHSKEALFYNHALPLPGFIFLASDIYDHAVLFNKSELYQVPVVGVTVPIMWFYLFMNVITQYVCIRGVFTLTTECTSLTVTLVVTLRKFVSLIFSILYFRNPFTLWHWLGTVFVFLGTLMYTEVWSNLGPPKGQPPKEDKRN